MLKVHGRVLRSRGLLDEQHKRVALREGRRSVTFLSNTIPLLIARATQAQGDTLAPSAFKSRALPLHVNVTHTPPVLADDDTTDVAQLDPGFIGSATLVPSSFTTGSYGWKGNKHVTVELQNIETGKKEQVEVMLT